MKPNIKMTKHFIVLPENGVKKKRKGEELTLTVSRNENDLNFMRESERDFSAPGCSSFSSSLQSNRIIINIKIAPIFHI